MFEVGKTYKFTNNETYKCLAITADGHQGWLQYNYTTPFTALWVGSMWVEVKPKVKVDLWVNVYEDGHIYPHLSEEDAKRGRSVCGKDSKDILAVAHIVQEVEEGEGL